LVFAAAGYLLANPDWGAVAVDVEAASVHLIAEVTLALLLFADAARVNVQELRSDPGLPTRLLSVGLPLCIVPGWPGDEPRARRSVLARQRVPST
jgi:NhaP-type Na+/H+ or K+/H+ antiporter